MSIFTKSTARWRIILRVAFISDNMKLRRMVVVEVVKLLERLLVKLLHALFHVVIVSLPPGLKRR